MSQIILQPDGDGKTYFAIFSRTVDDFTGVSMDEDEVVRHFASKAYEVERARVLKIIKQLRNGEKPYHQVTLTWDEANELACKAHPEHYGYLQKRIDAE